MIQKGDVAITQGYGLAAMCLAREAVPIIQDGMIPKLPTKIITTNQTLNQKL